MIGGILRDSRQQHGWTLEEVSRMADVSKSYLSMLENEKIAHPRFDVLCRLAIAYKVDCQSLLIETGYIQSASSELADGPWRTIGVSKGGETAVSSEDYGYLIQWRWNRHSGGYAVRGDSHKNVVYLHRVVVERMLGHAIPEGYEVDHVDGNKLNNKRENLRLATPSQNNINRPGGAGTSSCYKGVYWYKAYGKWHVQIRQGGYRYFVGYFDDEEDAARAYDAKAKELFGEFAYLNFPESVD